MLETVIGPMTVTYAILDGSTASIASIDGVADLSRPFGTTATFNTGRYNQLFVSGTSDHGQRTARQNGVDLGEEYTYRGGTLRLGKTKVTDPVTRLEALEVFVVWEIGDFSISTTIYNGDVVNAVQLLDRFQLEKRPSGLCLAPPDGSQVALWEHKPPRLHLNVPFLGLLEVSELTPTLARGLPDWSGAAVAGGELFVTGQDKDTTLFVLVGDSSFTLIHPNVWEASLEAILEKVTTLTTSWVKGSAW